MPKLKASRIVTYWSNRTQDMDLLFTLLAVIRFGLHLNLVHLYTDLPQRFPMFDVQCPFNSRSQCHSFNFFISVFIFIELRCKNYLGNIPEPAVVEIVDYLMDAADSVERETAAIREVPLWVVFHAMGSYQHST